MQCNERDCEATALKHKEHRVEMTTSFDRNNRGVRVWKVFEWDTCTEHESERPPNMRVRHYIVEEKIADNPHPAEFREI